MVHSIRSVALATLLILPYTVTASYYQEVEDGPNVLDECVACPRMYTNLYECQKIAQPGRVGDEVRNCVCVPAYDGWYTYLDSCRGCLPGTGTDDFWGNMGRMMTHLYHTCLSSGNITSDGSVLCASDEKTEDCMALRDSSQGETRVSFRWLDDATGKYDSNRTQLLNLAAVKANLTTSTTVEPAASTTIATGTAATGSDTTASASTTTPATGTGSQVPSGTTGQQRTTTTAAPSFAARLSQGSQAGYVLGMLIVAGIVGGLL
ncbi:hypothetical protein C8A01DRAFT_47893 [Parachaetomium inaequale]|uniref:Uncharacterized protein n=1 Tax=Parachaetomium inaequale TaxID=2588326 RepID=A0AAN6SPQ6_9PEZI|nr:hypothetical protein C8A01DRAFT_47893 [Parachaetomium inaequale]